MPYIWTCEECGETGPFTMDFDPFDSPHDCLSRGPFDRVSTLAVGDAPTEPTA